MWKVSWLYEKVHNFFGCAAILTRIHLWTPFMCAKFQSYQIMRVCFIAIFTKCAKDEEKKQRKKLKLWQIVSQKWLEQFPSNLACGLPLLENNSAANLGPIGYGIIKIQRCENDVFFHSVNIPMVWRTGFLGHTT